MRNLIAAIDLADVFCFVGAVCIAVTVYWLWPILTPAYVGVVCIAAGILRVLGRQPDGTPQQRR